MVYKEFAATRELPLYEINWKSEIGALHQAALDTFGLCAIVGGYLWALVLVLLMHPYFEAKPIVLPFSVAALGTLLVIVRQPLDLRRSILVVGMFAIATMALLLTRSLAAPFVYLITITCAALVAQATLSFVVAAASSASVAAAWFFIPGTWPLELVYGAMGLFWAEAITAWLASRNLYTVLVWALNSYEKSWRATRELQTQRGKLNHTLKDLANANLLLKRTTYELAQAREEAEQARQLKSQFAANISHELRTPLHLIVGFSQMMCMSPDSYRGVTWTPELRGDIREIFNSASHLLRLIDDVLDLSQIEKAYLPISRERISIASLIRETVDTAAPLLRDRGLYLRVDLADDLPSVYADPVRIRQVLLNLLNNASRFTYDGGITVRARNAGEDVEVIVEDTGIGIPPEQLEKVFLEFYQVDGSLQRRHGGTGLGLAICKQFVTLHGGRIWAESVVGQGSAFHFTLPLPGKTTGPVQQSEWPQGWRYPAAKPTVAYRLVTLSGASEFTRLIGRYLPDTELLLAETPEQAVELARRQQADARVLPEGTCPPQVASALARSGSEFLLPVITCSWPLEQHLALAQGFSHCLMKPFAADQLLQVLGQVAPQARRILVVDDDSGVGRLVERLLRAARPEVKVLCAYDGEEAIAMLAEQPDVVLLDLILPKVDGLAVLRELRQREGGEDIPVVAITAYGFQQEVALLGEGLITVRRCKHFSASEITAWLETVLQALPARHLTPGGRELEPIPTLTG
ncbi:MAG: ATP-binding protein [Anaerolineae bacterium]